MKLTSNRLGSVAHIHQAIAFLRLTYMKSFSVVIDMQMKRAIIQQ
jgi:hypothetical protein